MKIEINGQIKVIHYFSKAAGLGMKQTCNKTVSCKFEEFRILRMKLFQ